MTIDRPALLRPDGVILLGLFLVFFTDSYPPPARIGRLPPYNDRRGNHGRMVTLYLAFRHARTERRDPVNVLLPSRDRRYVIGLVT